MNVRTTGRLLAWILPVLLWSSCEDSMWLRSEKKMNEQLTGSWLRSFQGNTPHIGACPTVGDTMPYEEYWIFDGQNMRTTFHYGPYDCDQGTPDANKKDLVDTVIVCTYKIDAKLTRAFLKLTLVAGVLPGDTNSSFYDKWEFVNLTNDVLYLATDGKNGTNVEQREFSKVH